MKMGGISFYHPVFFWLGCVALVAGVLMHVPMFQHASSMGYRMVGMPMDSMMLLGMALIPLGLAFSAYGLMPRYSPDVSVSAINFQISDNLSLNKEHYILVTVLILAVAIDVLKPATLGFVVPGMMEEYRIDRASAGVLPLIALTGTAVGSVIWGRLADLFGRRASILLSALMFIGTAICGAMPSFEWNLVMCFLMGLSAGGLLPITFALMAEMVPVAHRGWMLVALGGVGTSAGYMLAAGSAAVLEPLFSWRALWMLGLPTGLVLIILNRYIPESPRFLANIGKDNEAKEVLDRFSRASLIHLPSDQAASHSDVKAADFRELMKGAYGKITIGLICCGVAWGLANFGFLLWLPTNLRSMGMDADAVNDLLAQSALFALPGVLLVIWLYHRWSSIKTLTLFILLTTFSLLSFLILGASHQASATSMVIATALLLVSSSGVISMLIPYAAEIYPVRLRGTGAGMVAASSKFGGILGAVFGGTGVFNDLTLSAFIISIPMAISAVMLINSGIDTRGRRLEDIHAALLHKASLATPAE